MLLYRENIKCADNTKHFRTNNGNCDKQQFQDDIEQLIKWSVKAQLLFNFE